MKKKYMIPEQHVVMLQHSIQLLSGSVTGLSNNADLEETITGGSEPGRAPDLFDDPAWDALLEK